MTVLGRGLVLQPVLVTQTCTYNSNNTITLQNIDMRERERQRDRERQRKRDRDRQTDRQTDRETDRQTDRRTDMDRQPDWQVEWQTDRQTDIQIGRVKTDWEKKNGQQTHRKQATDGQTDKQTDKKPNPPPPPPPPKKKNNNKKQKKNRQAEMDRQTDREVQCRDREMEQPRRPQSARTLR